MAKIKQIVVDNDDDSAPALIREQVESIYLVPVLKPSRYLSLTPEDLHQELSKYVNICIKLGCPITASGMANYLGTNRKTLIEIANGESTKEYDEEIIELISSGLSLCEQYAEQKLYSKESSGAIFALKNISHSNWKDRQEVTTKDESDINDSAIDELVSLLSSNINEIHTPTNKSGDGEDTQPLGQEI